MDANTVAKQEAKTIDEMRKKVSALFPTFITAFDAGGIQEAEKTLRRQCKACPQEAHIAKAAFCEIKSLDAKRYAN